MNDCLSIMMDVLQFTAFIDWNLLFTKGKKLQIFMELSNFSDLSSLIVLQNDSQLTQFKIAVTAEPVCVCVTYLSLVWVFSTSLGYG